MASYVFSKQVEKMNLGVIIPVLTYGLALLWDFSSAVCLSRRRHGTAILKKANQNRSYIFM